MAWVPGPGQGHVWGTAQLSSRITLKLRLLLSSGSLWPGMSIFPSFQAPSSPSLCLRWPLEGMSTCFRSPGTGRLRIHRV